MEKNSNLFSCFGVTTSPLEFPSTEKSGFDAVDTVVDVIVAVESTVVEVSLPVPETPSEAELNGHGKWNFLNSEFLME